MKFVCDRCQTKYSIADDKVRGKVLKVRCKTCQNVITVREVGAKPSQGSLAPVRRPSSAAIPTLGDSHDEQSERTHIAAAPTAFMAELAQGRRSTPPPPPPLGDGIEWFLALEGAQQGPFTRKLLVDRLLALQKDADVHVWNDRMDGWKPPVNVPDVARDLAARRALPVRPPVPRLTPSPPPPPLAARRGTQPLASGVGAKLPLPGPHVKASVAHAVPAPHLAGAGALDDALTPPPAAAHAHGVKTNGVTAHASSPSIPFPNGESDALSALNMGSAAARPASAPRIMAADEATAWSGAGRIQEGRHGNTKWALGLLVVVGVSVGVIVLNMTHKTPVVTAAPKQRGGIDSEALAKLSEIAAKQKEEPPPSTVAGPKEEPRPPEPVRGPIGKNARGRLRGRQAPGRGGTSPGPKAAPGAVAAPTAPATASPSGAGTRERTILPSHEVSRGPAPSQADIARVIANNKAGIKTCYQRALLRDSSLTHGKIVVGVTIGISGRVKKVTVDGPTSFRALEPCIKEMLQRWVFPQSYEEYGTEFSYLFQGNE
jgi:predicted Zn finger-like uncharacterized protein